MPPPSAQALPALLSRVRHLLPPSLPKSAAYILPACTLTALGHPNLLGPLFLHVTGHNAPSSQQPAAAAQLPPAETRTISLHLRDMLLKEWTLIGIPPVVTAVSSLGRAEQEAGLFPSDAPTTFDNPNWNAPPATSSPPPPSQDAPVLGPQTTLSPRYSSNPSDPTLSLAPGTPTTTRGAAHLHRLYQHHLPPILRTWASHEADFRWLEESVIYGLFLSDHSVLSDVETSLVTASAILAGSGLKAPTLWHLRGLRRLGLERGEVEAVVRVVGECAVWAGG
ncbi:hypothetical protein DBV05_g9711, partial [Lasiodiplodia theobromae]